MNKKLDFILVALIISLLLSCQNRNPDARGYIVNMGDIASDFTVQEAGGRAYKLSDLRGKLYFLQDYTTGRN